MPLPSAPITSATAPRRSTAAMPCPASPAAPTIHTPASCSARSVRARLVTLTSGTTSAAPEATLRAVAFSGAELSRGTITACAPKASAERRHAPRLWGSVTPSSTSSSAGPASPGSSSSNR